jgi:hypothetical protein
VAKTVAVDFDNTLHPYTRGWIGPEPDDEPAIEGAEEFLHALLLKGYHVVIHTTRADSLDGELGVIRWLKNHMPPIYYALRDDKTVSLAVRKPKAFAYVDDRAVPYRGDFTECLEQIEMLDLHGPVGGHRENR